MNFWEANRKLLISAGAVLLAALVLHFVLAAPSRSAALDLEQGNEGLRRDVSKLLPAGGLPAPDALKALRAERAKLVKVVDRLSGVFLEVPKKYRVPKEHKADPKFYFQKQLAELRKERCATRQYPAKNPLGFTDTLSREKPGRLLECLAAADRLTAAVRQAGLARVRYIRHGRASTRAAKGVKNLHLLLLPMTLCATADEQALVAFLQEISKEGRFLALRSLEVEVTNPRARTFNMVVEVTALLPCKGPGARKARPGDVTRTLPIGRY